MNKKDINTAINACSNKTIQEEVLKVLILTIMIVIVIIVTNNSNLKLEIQKYNMACVSKSQDFKTKMLKSQQYITCHELLSPEWIYTEPLNNMLHKAKHARSKNTQLQG